MNSSGHFMVTPSFHEDVEDGGVLGDEIKELAEQIIVFAMLPVNLVGMATNLVNIRVFASQGILNDNTNFCFLSLSVFDLLNCATLVPISLCYVFKTTHDLPNHRTCIAFASIFILAHSALQQCSSWTTVYMSVVRSFCVYIPLKVKQIFTPKLAIVIIVSQFIIFLMIQLMYDIYTEIVWVFDPQFNKSFAILVDKPAIQEYLYISTILNYQVLSVVSIIIVSVTTSLMVRKLIQISKWRQANASGKETMDETDNKHTNQKSLASKDIELMKSVTIITGIFMVCVSMSYIPAIAMIVFPGMSFSGVNRNLFSVVFLVRFLFDAINSSINFFFYIRISSRYKSTFASLFPKCSGQKLK